MDIQKILSITEELENDWTDREKELRFLKNQLINIEESQRDIYRKSLVLMLYSHYEGFCSFAFNTYILAINEERISRREAHDSLVTASMSSEFNLFEDENYKEKRYKDMFGKKPPDDKKLYKASKRIHLVSAFNDWLLEETLDIPDKVVNTESNLWPIVLKKLLYVVGLPYDAFNQHEDTIKKLLNLRNGIAHGDFREGVDEQEYLKLETATFSINRTMIRLITNALEEKKYLKSPNDTC